MARTVSTIPAVVVAGHVCVDLVPKLPALPASRPGELAEIGPLRVSPGGCVANTAGDLAALGATVHAVGDAGDDELGAMLVEMLAARGTRTEGIRRLSGRSTSYSVVLQPPGLDRSFWHHVGANAAFDGSAVKLGEGALLHVGYPSLLPALSASGGAPLEALLRRARAAGMTTSLDLAVLDPASSAAALDWPAILGRVLPLVDVMTPSIDDVRTALGDAGDPTDTASRLVGMGAGVVMVTAGPAGLTLRTAEGARLADAGALFSDPEVGDRWSAVELFTPAQPVDVRTTLGAGDAATAGLLYGVLARLGPAAALRLAADTAAARVGGAVIGPRLHGQR